MIVNQRILRLIKSYCDQYDTCLLHPRQYLARYFYTLIRCIPQTKDNLRGGGCIANGRSYVNPD